MPVFVAMDYPARTLTVHSIRETAGDVFGPRPQFPGTEVPVWTRDAAVVRNYRRVAASLGLRLDLCRRCFITVGDTARIPAQAPGPSPPTSPGIGYFHPED